MMPFAYYIGALSEAALIRAFRTFRSPEAATARAVARLRDSLRGQDYFGCGCFLAALFCVFFAGAASEAGAQSRTIGFTMDSLMVSESTMDVTDTLSVELSSGTGPVSYQICLEDGTATLADNDYAAWPDGDRCVEQEISASESSGIVQLSLPADATDEPEEAFTVRLSLPATVPGLALDSSRETAAVVIEDDDPTVVRLSREDDFSTAVSEAQGDVFVRVELGRTLEAGERVDVPLVLSGSGIALSDFRLSSRIGGMHSVFHNSLTPVITLTGGVQHGFLVATPEKDDVDEGGSETLTVSLAPAAQFEAGDLKTNVGGGAEPHGAQNSIEVVILDVTPVIDVDVFGGDTVTEGETAEFIFRSDPAPGADMLLRVLVYDLPGPDTKWLSAEYDEVQILTMPADSTSLRYSVPTIDTPEAEGNGTVWILLHGPPQVGYLSDTVDAFVMILDNDTPPAVRIAGGPGIAEGGLANFTLTADPAPVGATIVVNVRVVDSGDFAGSGQAGSRTVTIGESGTASLSVATVDDGADEPDGTITATVAAGDGYAPDVANRSASVVVSDNDDAPPPGMPSVRIAAGDAVTEGGLASFALTADPAPDKDIVVNVQVVDSGDFAGSGQAGLRTATIGASGTASVSVATVDDGANEPDGTITATVAAGDGYAPDVANRSASVVVSDNDDAPPTAHPEVTLAVSPNPVSEGESVTVTASLSRTLASAVEIPLAISAGTAEAGDYGALALIRIAGNESSGTGAIATARDDDADDETFIVSLGTLPAEVEAGSPSLVEIVVSDTYSSSSGVTSTEPDGEEIPRAFALKQNYPNPFNPQTTIRYSLPQPGDVRLAVYNVLGHEVAVLVDGPQPAGQYAAQFSGADLPSGLYVYRLQAAGEMAARAMMLAK